MPPTQAEKDAVLAQLDHAVDDITKAYDTVATWPVTDVPEPKPPKILSFTGSPTTLPPSGGGVQLTWSTQDATGGCFLNGIPVPATDTTTRQITTDTTFTLEALGDGPTDSKVVTIDVTAVVPPVDGLVPAVGTSIESAMFNRTAKGDRFDPAKFPGYIPYHCFSDPEFSIIAPAATVPVTRWVRVTHAVDTGLYVPVSRFVNGRIEQAFYSHATDDMEWLANQLRVEQPRVGRRNEGWPGPYITVKSHPNATTSGSNRSPPFMALRADGLVLGIMPNGDTNLMLTLDQTVKTYHDMALNPLDPKQLWVTCANEGRIDEVIRDKLTIVSQKPIATGMGYVSSVVLVGGMLYAADQTQNKIWKIDPVTHERTVACSMITKPSWLSETEKPDEIAVLSWFDNGLFYVNTQTGVAGPNLTPPEHRTQTLFGMIDVDVTGAATGRKGLLAMGRTHDDWGGTNNAVQIYWQGQWNPSDPNALPMGGLAAGSELFHYLWYSCFHREQSLWYIGGTADISGTMLRGAQPTDPEWGPYTEPNEGFPMRHLDSQGMLAAMRGSPLGVAEDKYPSASCVVNSSASGIYNGDWFGRGCPDNLPNGDCGPRIEDAATRQARRKAWIYGGFGGSYPRPEFMPIAAGGVRYGDFYTCGIGIWMLRRSQEYLVRGVACLDEWRAEFPVDMEVPWPIILNHPDYNASFLQTVLEGDGLRVYYQDRYGSGNVPPNTTIDLYVEYGLSGQKQLASVQTGPEPGKSLYWPGPHGMPPGDWIFSAVAQDRMSMASVAYVT